MAFAEVAACCADTVSIDRDILYYHSYIRTPTHLFIVSTNQSDIRLYIRTIFRQCYPFDRLSIDRLIQSVWLSVVILAVLLTYQPDGWLVIRLVF